MSFDQGSHMKDDQPSRLSMGFFDINMQSSHKKPSNFVQSPSDIDQISSFYQATQQSGNAKQDMMDDACFEDLRYRKSQMTERPYQRPFNLNGEAPDKKISPVIKENGAMDQTFSDISINPYPTDKTNDQTGTSHTKKQAKKVFPFDKESNKFLRKLN